MQRQPHHLDDNTFGESTQANAYQQAMIDKMQLLVENSNLSPYARIPGGQFMMLSGSRGVGSVGLNSGSMSTMTYGIPGLSTPSEVSSTCSLPPVSSSPPLTSFVRNVTPDYHLPLMNMKMAGCQNVGVNSINSIYPTIPNSLTNLITGAGQPGVSSLSSLARTQFIMNKAQSNARAKFQEEGLNLCTDSLLGDEVSDNGVNDEFSTCDNYGKFSMPSNVLTSIPFQNVPRSSYSNVMANKKRKFDTCFKQAVLVHEEIKSSKNAGAGAASWNAAVRKDISKAFTTNPMTSYLNPQKCLKKFYSDTPSSSYSTSKSDNAESSGRMNDTNFLFKEACSPTYKEALNHEFLRRQRLKKKTKSSVTTMNSQSSVELTSLARTVTDEKKHAQCEGHPSSIDNTLSNENTLKLTSLKRSVTEENETGKNANMFDDSLCKICDPEIKSKKLQKNEKVKKRKLLLATKEDKHWLSDLVCLIRENIEVFAATPEDVAARSRRGGIKKPIDCGRVGIRCIHCAHLPHEHKAKGAVSYPNSIRIVHQAVRNWQRYHFDACSKIPASVKKAYTALKSTRSHSGNASLKYWIDSTKRLGLIDTNADDGIRFAPGRNPAEELVILSPPLIHEREILSKICDDYSGGPPYLSSTASEIDRTKDDMNYDQPSLVTPADKHLITDFLYELLDQQQACKYKIVDRNGKRKYRELGFPGVECKHCARNAGAGRYFPLVVTTLANNNNPFNCTHSHMMKCRRCPQEVKNKLAQLQLMHAEQSTALPVGWKKSFFDKLWCKLHGSNKSASKDSLERRTTELKIQNSSSLAKVEKFDDEMDSAALALSSFSAQAFSDAARDKGQRNNLTGQ